MGTAKEELVQEVLEVDLLEADIALLALGKEVLDQGLGVVFMAKEEPELALVELEAMRREARVVTYLVEVEEWVVLAQVQVDCTVRVG